MLLITNLFTSSPLTGNILTSGLLWQYPNGNIVFRDQECRVFKEKGRKVDSSDWDFEEPQVRMVKCTVCKKHRKNCECCPGHYLSTSVY